MASHLNVIVEGCCHGELDNIYASIAEVERRRGVKVDLLLCCGDFQACRDLCEDHPRCLAFTWVKTEQACWLKGAGFKATKNNNRTDQRK